jgi:DNA-directed RNA polymerase subunit L
VGRPRYYIKDKYGEPNGFAFEIESECGLRPEYLVFKGLRVLHQKVSDLTANIQVAEAPLPGVIAPVCVVEHNVPGMFEFTVAHEDHTLGNLVQALLFNRHVRDNHTLSPASSAASQQLKLDHIGYTQPHPLEDCINIRVKVSTPSTLPLQAPRVSAKDGPGDVRAFMASCLDYVTDLLDDLTDQWLEFTSLGTEGIEEVRRFLEMRAPQGAPELDSPPEVVSAPEVGPSS